MKEFRRHDLLKISFEGRSRIFQELVNSGTELPTQILSDTLLNFCGKDRIPAVVRRGPVQPEGYVNAGFVSVQVINGSKAKIACTVSEREIVDLISPYVLPFCKYNERNKCLEALRAVSAMPEAENGKIGVAGSAAMEVVTGLSYTNDESDLDIIIRDSNLKEVFKTCTNLIRIGQQYDVSMDVEVQLKNGYGVKAKELFIGSSTLLGKGLFDVQLLERAEVEDLLKDNK